MNVSIDFTTGTGNSGLPVKSRRNEVRGETVTRSVYAPGSIKRKAFGWTYDKRWTYNAR